MTANNYKEFKIVNYINNFKNKKKSENCIFLIIKNIPNWPKVEIIDEEDNTNKVNLEYINLQYTEILEIHDDGLTILCGDNWQLYLVKIMFNGKNIIATSFEKTENYEYGIPYEILDEVFQRKSSSIKDDMFDLITKYDKINDNTLTTTPTPTLISQEISRIATRRNRRITIEQQLERRNEENQLHI
jgi:hypothetical protein